MKGDLGKIKGLKFQCFPEVCPFKLGQWYFKDYNKMTVGLDLRI